MAKRIPSSKTALGPRPKQPGNLKPTQIARDTQRAAERSLAEQRRQLAPFYGQLENLQQGTVSEVAGALRNPYTRAALDAARGGVRQATGIDGAADRMANAGMMIGSFGQNLYRQGPNALEQQIYGLGQGAMGMMADQVRGPRSIREVDAAQAGAANAGVIAGPDAAQADAARAGAVRLGNAPSMRAAQAGRTQLADAPLSQAARARMVEGPDAAMAERVMQIGRGATDVGSGALGSTLLANAQRGLRSGGRLSAQEERDVAQSTRASFAARGLATSAPAAMSEALNRDRYSRQRLAEERNFAQDVQAADIGRQQNNSQRQLAALQGNQQVGAQMSLADQDALNRARAMDYQGSIDQGQFNAANRQQTNLSNQQLAGQFALNQGQMDQARRMENAGMRQQAGAANMDMAGRFGMTGAEMAQNMAQFNAANRQQANLANQSSANQMAQLGYQGSIDQRQFNAANQQQAGLANMQSRNQIGLANQQRDQALGEMSMRAQMANQQANQNQLAQNRGFMSDAATIFNQNQLARVDAGTRMAGLGGTLLGQSADARGLGANVGFQGSRAMLDIDPYARALPLGIGMGQFAAGMGSEMIGGNAARLQDLYGNAASFNANMGQGRYNAWLNNATALRTGQMAAGSQLQAANISAAATKSANNRPWWEVGLNTIGSLFG